MNNVYDLEYYRLHKQNDELMDVIVEILEDREKLVLNLRVLKACLFEWHETNELLRNWNNADYKRNVRLAQRMVQ